MLRKKYSEPAPPDGQQALLEFETPADQPGKKDPKQFFKKNWKKITAVVCAAAVAAAVLLPRKSAKPAQADVYYYNASAKTVWIYSRKAAGRITAVSPSASAPTSVTVAGTSYTIASSSVASQLSSLNGGVAIGKSTSGTVKSMRQLLPAVIDKVGAASVMSGGKKYETADDMQVYLWCKGTYYPTTLSQVNSEDYSLIGWYDANGSAAGGKIRVLIAVKKD